MTVDLGYAAAEPPAMLYHGTAERNWTSIQAKGLVKGDRHHVHLSADRDTALKVGARHGKPLVLHVDSTGMHADGLAFYRSANGVWLTDAVPVAYLNKEEPIS